MYRFGLPAVVATLCLLSAAVHGQDLPKTCAESASLAITTAMNGVWWTAASSMVQPYQCGMVNVQVNSDNTSMQLDFTYANGTDYTQNYTVSYTVPLDPTNVSGGVQVVLGPAQMNQPLTVKLLAMQPDTQNAPGSAYSFVCGLTNMTDNASSFGVILTATRDVPQQTLDSLESIASAPYANFRNGTMTPIVQDAMCYSGAATKLPPLLAALVAFLCLTVKLFH